MSDHASTRQRPFLRRNRICCPHCEEPLLSYIVTEYYYTENPLESHDSEVEVIYNPTGRNGRPDLEASDRIGHPEAIERANKTLHDWYEPMLYQPRCGRCRGAVDVREIDDGLLILELNHNAGGF